MTEKECQKIYFLTDMLKGEINRMCVTDELKELESLYEFAQKNLLELKNFLLERKKYE